MTDSLLSVSDAARRLGANPRDITDLFYRRQLRDDIAPIIAGRRLIPVGYLDLIRMELVRSGRPVAASLPPSQERREP